MALPCGHDRPEHGRSGKCQACYRRDRRRVNDPLVGTRKPGPAPDPSAPRSRHAPARQPNGAPEPTRRMTEEEKAARRAERKAAKTHCVNGHLLDEQNTYTTSKGQKVCRICTRNAQQRFHGRPESGDVPIGPRNTDKTHCPQGHEYTPENTYTTGGTRHCKACARDGRLKYLYGLPRGGYEALLDRQHGACAGCKRALDEENLHVDHDHACCPGKRSCGECVRGLLCERCNLVLGHVGDDVEVLRSLVKYLRRGTVRR